jgi:hypothetical protein
MCRLLVDSVGSTMMMSSRTVLKSVANKVRTDRGHEKLPTGGQVIPHPTLDARAPHRRAQTGRRRS